MVDFAWTRYAQSCVPYIAEYSLSAVSPLLLAEARDYVRVSDSGEDAALLRLLGDAAKRLQEETARVLINTTVTQYYDLWPWDYDNVVHLERAPVSSLTSIKYYDTDDVQQTWDSANYETDLVGEPGRIVIAEAATLVSPNVDQRPNAVEVAFVAGYGTTAADLPDDAILALLQRVKYNYDCGRGLSASADATTMERCWQNAIRLLTWHA